MQVLMAQRQGFTETFRSTGSIPLYVDCGDCDEDIDVAEYLLENPHLTRNTMNPRLNRLVHMVDMLDSTAGSYAFPGDLPMMGQLAWIFDPYRRFRTSGEIDKKDANSYKAIIKEVGTRIRDHLLGCGDSIDLDPRYKRIGGGKGWVMIQELGAQAKMGMFADGHTAYLSVRERPDGRFTYVAGKTAFAKLNLPRLFDRLNELEGCPNNDQWGGGDLVGGSPRVAGSSLSPDRVGEVIDETVH